MSDFLAVIGCLAALIVCFFVMKNAGYKKTLRLYPSGGKLTMEQGKFYDVCFGFSEQSLSMQFTGASFVADTDGIDATVKFDSRPRQFVTFIEGK